MATDTRGLTKHADYLFTIHLHVAHLMKQAGNVAEEERWRTLSTTFLHVSHAARQNGNDHQTIVALADYLENVGRCEYKNILGHGRPAHDDCSEHGFFMCDERARIVMNESRHTLDKTHYPTKSCWGPAPATRENGDD